MPAPVHRAVDSVLIGSQIVNALQSIVARNVDPLKSAVISITMFPGRHGLQHHPGDRQARWNGAHARS